MGVTYNPRIVTDGLVFCVDAANKRSYPGSGSTWNDLSKNRNNGTLNNMTSANVINTNGGVFLFDAADDYIDTSQEIQFDRTDPFTLCAWLNNQDTGYANIMNNENTSYRGYQFSFFDQKLQIYLRSTTSNYIAVKCSNNFTLNAWKHCIATYDGSSDVSGMKLYIDGVLQATINLAEGYTYVFNYPSAHPFRFSTTSDGTHSGGTEYTTGVTHNSSTQTTIVVADSAPQLYYYCSIHSGMGGQANTVDADTWGVLQWGQNTWSSHLFN